MMQLRLTRVIGTIDKKDTVSGGKKSSHTAPFIQGCGPLKGPIKTTNILLKRAPANTYAM